MDLITATLNEYTQEILTVATEAGVFTNLTLLSWLLASLASDRPFPLTATSFKKEYDYIIVGGGTAGSVMANRLSQKPCVSVLLLEAGGEAPFLTDLPSWAILFYKTRVDWNYTTTPQRYTGFGQIENRITWNSGRVLGGGSVLNAMLYVRGNKQDFDDWEADGAAGWGYEDVFPYFLKLEDNRNINELDPGYHRRGGPQTVEKPQYTAEIKIPSIKATMNMGYRLTDSNGRRQTGIYDFQGMLRNGRRCSAAKGYLVPAENRSNLDILKNAFARKILIKDKIAYGVEFDYEGRTHHVFAKQEVIISSGTVRTPQILMLSGIGPRKQLRKFNIPVVADLPVGKNLQDHPTTYLPFLLDSRIEETVTKSIDPVNLVDFVINHAGPVTEPNQVSVITFLDGMNPMNGSVNSRDCPKVHLLYSEYSAFAPRNYYNLKPEVYEQVFGPYEGRPMWVCIVALLQPKSRGEIKLQSTNPYDPPLINPNYYKDERDVREVVEGLKFCHSIGTSKEMQKVQSTPFNTTFPGCEQFLGDMDQYFECYARSWTVTYWHPVGTARMGDPRDPRSVVDPQLRVIGVQRLRVINAAVMPKIPTGNTNTPTEMIAEKIYDVMKNDIQCHEPPYAEWKTNRDQKPYFNSDDTPFPRE